MADPDVARTTVVSCCRYLTAPYLRVPLLLSLFADATRVRALGSPELRDVLDACLFEPGPWQPRDAWDAEGGLATDGGFGAGGGGGATTTQTAPAGSRACFATPCGLLFNEASDDALAV